MLTIGRIEVYGFSATLDGILICGWVEHNWSPSTDDVNVCISFGEQKLRGAALLTTYKADRIKRKGQGLLLFFPTSACISGPITSIEIEYVDSPPAVLPAEHPLIWDETQLFEFFIHALADGTADRSRAQLRKLLERPHYNSADTLSGSHWPVHFEVDKAYLCPPGGLLLRGWMIDPFNMVKRMRVCSSAGAQSLNPNTWVRVKRRDVATAFNERYGLLDDMCGYLAYVPNVAQHGSSLYLALDISSSTVYRPLVPSLVMGLTAIKEILAAFDLRRDELQAGFDHVIGPAVMSLNNHRLLTVPRVIRTDFGGPISAPRASVIVPLYGRVDFMEYQLALFEASVSELDEIIYVLDDPDRRQDTENIATSCFAKFKRNFSLIVLSRNVGYAPANNVGLAQARGDYICFLNSDVIPKSGRWLDSMCAMIEGDPTLGIVSAQLLYEDDTLQHDGCTFQRLDEFASWPFPMHPGKGLLPPEPFNTSTRDAVTGACMVLKRELARKLGGFHEGFVIGDFEDVDLCLRVRSSGLRCAISPEATLYHLERQSQNLHASSWRLNLTLFNAWLFQSRWKDIASNGL